MAENSEDIHPPSIQKYKAKALYEHRRNKIITAHTKEQSINCILDITYNGIK